MRKPTGLYIGDSYQINENYKTYIDGLHKSCESIEQITEYLNFKLTPRGGGAVGRRI